MDPKDSKPNTNINNDEVNIIEKVEEVNITEYTACRYSLCIIL